MSVAGHPSHKARVPVCSRSAVGCFEASQKSPFKIMFAGCDWAILVFFCFSSRKSPPNRLLPTYKSSDGQTQL